MEKRILNPLTKGNETTKTVNSMHYTDSGNITIYDGAKEIEINTDNRLSNFYKDKLTELQNKLSKENTDYLVEEYDLSGVNKESMTNSSGGSK